MLSGALAPCIKEDFHIFYYSKKLMTDESLKDYCHFCAKNFDNGPSILITQVAKAIVKYKFIFYFFNYCSVPVWFMENAELGKQT